MSRSEVKNTAPSAPRFPLHLTKPCLGPGFHVHPLREGEGTQLFTHWNSSPTHFIYIFTNCLLSILLLLQVIKHEGIHCDILKNNFFKQPIQWITENQSLFYIEDILATRLFNYTYSNSRFTFLIRTFRVACASFLKYFISIVHFPHYFDRRTHIQLRVTNAFQSEPLLQS